MVAVILLATAALDGYIREAALIHEIAQLKIEINQARRQQQVDEITESQFFHNLKNRAEEMRAKNKDE